MTESRTLSDSRNQSGAARFDDDPGFGLPAVRAAAKPMAEKKRKKTKNKGKK
jgi:hypothetical protein